MIDLSFEDNVFAYEVLDSRHYRATIPLHPITSLRGPTVLLRYSGIAPAVAGRIHEFENEYSPSGHLTHLTVETDDLAGMLAAEATRNLATSA